MREKNKYMKYSRDELLVIEERLSRDLDKRLLYGWRDVESLRDELRLVYEALNPDEGGASSPMKFHKVTVELEIHVAEGTYFPPSVEPSQEFKWSVFAESPHEADEIFNECRVYNVINNAVTNIHGLSIGELKVATSGVGYTDENEEAE